MNLYPVIELAAGHEGAVEGGIEAFKWILIVGFLITAAVVVGIVFIVKYVAKASSGVRGMCKKCGSSVRSGNTTCTKCGAEMDWS